MPRDWLQELVDIVERLRSPGGCAWDREQTHESLKRYLVEESAEFLDAVDEGDDDAMEDELGDLLLQAFLHARMGAERGSFDIQSAARRVCEKMRRRHPHVFGDAEAETPDAVLRQWDVIKRRERGGAPKSALSGVPRHLPALHRAHDVQKKAARVGFDWPDVEGVMAKIEEELAEVRDALAAGDPEAVAAEIGDLLFAVVNLGRFRQLLAEELLHGTVRKFERRFQRMEGLLEAQGKRPESCSLDELDALWERAKAEERGE